MEDDGYPTIVPKTPFVLAVTVLKAVNFWFLVEEATPLGWVKIALLVLLAGSCLTLAVPLTSNISVGVSVLMLL